MEYNSPAMGLLDRLEGYLQDLVEGSFARLFAEHVHPRDVAVRVARAMEKGVENSVAPDVYIIRLNPRDHRALVDDQPAIIKRMSEEIVQMARYAGYTLGREPDVRMLADSTVGRHAVVVAATHSEEAQQSTNLLSGVPKPSAKAPDAILSLSDKRHIPLDRPVVNLGRERGNHIIIDDSRVSRHHAQIRLRFGRYVLFDVGSSGGTQVNGHPVKEAILRPGDVISLAGYTLMYIEESDDGDLPDTQASQLS